MLLCTVSCVVLVCYVCHVLLCHVHGPPPCYAVVMSHACYHHWVVSPWCDGVRVLRLTACCLVLDHCALSITTTVNRIYYPRQLLNPASYNIPSTYTMLLWQGIDSGNASALPSPVLRSMLKQRRILMRMH